MMVHAILSGYAVTLVITGASGLAEFEIDIGFNVDVHSTCNLIV